MISYIAQIPTIVAYQDGDAVSFGAEARDYLGDPAYEIAQWFKVGFLFFLYSGGSYPFSAVSASG
jgi:hypothetical protein